jgi:hypothetical protein
MRLSFDVRGDNATDIQRRAQQVVHEFLDTAEDGTINNSDIEIDVRALHSEEHPEAPMPTYSFIGHVSARIRP